MPTCFAFTIDQLYILGVSIGLFLLGTIAINIAASWSKTGDDERAEIRRHWLFIGRCWVVITVAIIFWVGFNNASPAPTTIKTYEDPPVVEATPRSAIEEQNEFHAVERRRERRELSDEETGELQDRGAALYRQLMTQEPSQRDAECCDSEHEDQ